MSDKDEFNGFQTGNTPNEYENDSAASPVEHDPWADTGATPASQDSVPDLDQNLPSLSGSTSQKLNKKGLFFLSVVAVLGFSMAAVAYKKIFPKSDGTEQVVKEEQIIVPNRPVGPPRVDPPLEVLPPELPVLSDPTASMPMVDIPVEPIQAQNNLPNIPGVAQLTGQGGEKPLTLAERRALQSGSVYGSGGNAGGMGGAAATLPAAAGGGGLFGGAGDGAAAAATPVAATNAARRIRNPDTLLLRGSYIRCALETRLVSDVAGYTSCIVTDPIYSMNGRKLLIERGSRVSGVYNDGDVGNGVYDRAAVLWNRVVTPSGRDIQLDSPGIDRLGGAGHPGQYDAHWGQRLAASILVSLVADAINWGMVEHGPTVTRTVVNSDGTVTSSEESFDSKTVDNMSKMAEQVLSKTMNRKATVTINQGTILNIYVARDVDFASVLD